MRLHIKKAFTLIELLVVISIIALLMAVLMPSLNKARKMARRVVCSSQMRQVGIAELLYGADTGRLLPRYVSAADEIKGGDSSYNTTVSSVLPFVMKQTLWQHIKQSYGVEAEFMVCPTLLAQRDTNGQKKYINDGDLTIRHSGSTYWPEPAVWTGYNHVAGLCNMSQTDPLTVPESAASLHDKSDKLIWADGVYRYGWRDFTEWQSVVPHPGKNGLPEGSNSIRLDGSAEWVGASEMAWDDTPISNNARGKFRHVPGGQNGYWPRSYFW
jgi:prepilin-type N-terminal cleavage/methylation domain-containing protein